MFKKLFESMGRTSGRNRQSGFADLGWLPKPLPVRSNKTPAAPPVDYRAVSVVPRMPSCPAAMQSAGVRQFLRTKPRLPLDSCNMPHKCTCKFQLHSDRRHQERRAAGVVWQRMVKLGIDRRRATDRRSVAR
jgi:hypothetical protein